MKSSPLRTASLLIALAASAACGSAGSGPRVKEPPSAIKAGYDRALRDLWSHYWDASTHNGAGAPRIRATQGDGGPANGLVVDAQRATTFWQMAQFHKLLFGQWKFDRSAAADAAIRANWAAVQATYTPAQLRGDGRDDHSINISDDAGWKANFLAQVHAVTRDPEALHDLEEMLPAVMDRFVDANQPRIMHGTTPAGRPLRSNPHGILYAAAKDLGAYAAFGRISSLYETTLALAALYAYEQDHDTAYLSYATSTYRWIHADLRTVKDSPNDTATGVYLCDLSLDPAKLATGHAQPKNRYFGKPIRGLAAEYDGGTLAMAVLAARLYRLTGTEMYLVEAKNIIGAFARPDAFLRQRQTNAVFVDARDPWTAGYWYPEVAAEVLPLPGVDPHGTFHSAMASTAAAIVGQRTSDGYYGADWSGPELDIADGTQTWIESGNRINAGRGGGQATPRQIMTSANSTLVIQAAHVDASIYRR